MDKTKDWQLELLMEKLRSKSGQCKPLAEISKNVRMVLLDKRFALDSVDKAQHQKCLDTLQHSIKVTTLQSMVERLECLTRQLGLKFQLASDTELFISSDMFYLEIILESSGKVTDVKVHHDGKQELQSCEELVQCLSRGDFADFTAQLEGFASIYQLNAEKMVKCEAFTALQSLENDLFQGAQVGQLQGYIKDPFSLLHKSPLGILEKRKGGHPMKLTYFVSPYDLIDRGKRELETLSAETIIKKKLGYNVTIYLEGSTAHKLQTSTLLTMRTHNGKSTPTYNPTTPSNSAVIPAYFVLRLNRAMPMCVTLLRQIQQITELECKDTNTTHPLLSLICTHSSDGKMDSANNKGLFVTLPDQQHCYFFTENRNLDGVLVHSIPFTHPSHVAQVIAILRQQALFNTIISSCVRPNSKQDFDHLSILEISAFGSGPLSISVSLEHPHDETLATAELDLSDVAALSCRVYRATASTSSNADTQASDLATKVLNRTCSIPVTMRAVLKMWNSKINSGVHRKLSSNGNSNGNGSLGNGNNNHFTGLENFNLPLGAGDPGGGVGGGGRGGGGSSSAGGNLNNNSNQDMDLKSGNHHDTLNLMAQQHQGLFLNDSIMNSATFSPFTSATSSQISSASDLHSQASMLTNMELANILGGETSSSNLKTTKKPRNNKTDDLNCYKSTSSSNQKLQRRSTATEETELLLLESTSSSDSTSRSTPLSQETVSEICTPNSQLGFHSDLEFSELISDKVSADFDQDDLGDMEDILAGTKSSKMASPTLELLEGKAVIPPSVSITPITSNQSFSSGLSGLSRPGIEIIPISTTSSGNLPSSITITPITTSSSSSKSEKDKKSSKYKSGDDKSKLEKKRKRRREDSPMGPPEKIPSSKLQDPLSKPVSVTIKPSLSPPPILTPNSPNMVRKFSNQSPTHNRSSINPGSTGKLSPSLIKPKTSSSSIGHSPKHSPKHIGGLSSPKHGTSPKHPSTGSSGGGKPSMSALKNATNSPSNKSPSGSTTGLNSSGGEGKLKSTKDSTTSSNKDKKQPFSSIIPTQIQQKNIIKSSSSSTTTNKVKPLDLNAGLEILGPLPDGLLSPTGLDLTKLSNSSQAARNRKSTLSAIVDKLKYTAQHCDSPADLTKQQVKQPLNKPLSTSSGGTSLPQSVPKPGDKNSSEYMVKPSSDGIKLTINKTRTKDSSSSGSSKSSSSSSSSSTKTSSTSGGTGSPKTHTGLKPGVNSGPASKKPQQAQKSSSTSAITSSTGSSSSTSSSYAFKSSGSSSSSSLKSISCVNSTAKPSSMSSSSGSTSGTSLSMKSSMKMSSGSPKTSSSSSGSSSSLSDLNRSSKDRDRLKLPKSNSDKSIFSNRDRKGSPTQQSTREDIDNAFKMANYGATLMIDGAAKFDKNFQIPKLSARNTNPSSSSDDKKAKGSSTVVDNLSMSKMYESKPPEVSLSKYLPSGSIFDNAATIEAKIRNSMNSSSTVVTPNRSTSPSISKVNTDNTMIDVIDEQKKQTKIDVLTTSKVTTPSVVGTVSTALSMVTQRETTIEPILTKFVTPAAPKDVDLKKVDLTAAKKIEDVGSSAVDKLTTSSSSSTTSTVSFAALDKGSLSYPPSPSVSVHIVKSPAPSPHLAVNQSPRSVASPCCITDDELMDEALCLGK